MDVRLCEATAEDRDELGRLLADYLVRVRADDGGWGIARTAVEALAEPARAAGATHLIAKIHSDNRDALRFWHAVGFREIAASGPIVTRREL